MQEFHAGAPTPAPLVVGSEQQSSAEVSECHLLRYRCPGRPDLCFCFVSLPLGILPRQSCLSMSVTSRSGKVIHSEQ